MSEKKYLDFYNKEYPFSYELNHVKKSPMLDRRIFAFVKKTKNENFNSICDVGCSVGRLLNVSKNKIKIRVGVDISKPLLKEAKKFYPDLMLVQASAIFLPFKDNSFEICTSFQVVEHIEDYQLAISEIIRISKNKILLSTDCWTKNNPTKKNGIW